MAGIFEVDGAKCVKCGACVRDCAFGALKMADGAPRMVFPERCMKCQHCLAICPTGAVTFDGRKPEDSVLMKGLALPTLDEVENWFTCFPTRAATDRFRAGFISAIERHRDGTRLLPRWLAVPAIRLRKGGEDMFFRGASGILIVSSDETAPGVTTPREDVTIACAQFEMLANAAGIATCWCGFLGLVQKEVPEILEATVGIRRTTPFYAMLFGRPAVHYARCVQRDSYARIDYR